MLQRTESKDGQPNSFLHLYYYAAGRRVGDVSTDPTSQVRISYAEQLAIDLQAKPDRSWSKFKDITPVTSADFDQNYEPISSSYPGPTASTYTVRSGDSLRSIAQTLWGDAAMWYFLAEANGLTEGSPLSNGQVLVVPNKVTNIHNNANTYRPYNPGEVIGNIDPTLPTPPPPPKKGCGTLGVILMVVVAVAVTVWTAGAAASALGVVGSTATGAAASTFGTGLAVLSGGTAAGITTAAAAGGIAASIGVTAAGVAAAAVGSAVGSIASQGVGLLSGNIDKFQWANVSRAAFTGGVTAGVGSMLNQAAAAGGILDGTRVGSALSAGGWQGAALRAGAGQATVMGLKGDWNWRRLAASSVAAGVTHAVSNSSILQSAMSSFNPQFSQIALNTLGAAAGGWAGAQAVGYNRQESRAQMGQAFVSGLGNAIALGLGGGAGATQGQGPWSEQNYVNGMDLASDQATAQRDALYGLRGAGARLGERGGAAQQWSDQVDRGIRDKARALVNWDGTASRVWAGQDAQADRRATLAQNTAALAYRQELAARAAQPGAGGMSALSRALADGPVTTLMAPNIWTTTAAQLDRVAMRDAQIARQRALDENPLQTNKLMYAMFGAHMSGARRDLTYAQQNHLLDLRTVSLGLTVDAASVAGLSGPTLIGGGVGLVAAGRATYAGLTLAKAEIAALGSMAYSVHADKINRFGLFLAETASSFFAGVDSPTTLIPSSIGKAGNQVTRLLRDEFADGLQASARSGYGSIGGINQNIAKLLLPDFSLGIMPRDSMNFGGFTAATNVLDRADLGLLLGRGGNKDVFAFGENLAVCVLREGKNPRLLTEEFDLLRRLDELGLPTVNARGPVSVGGQPGLVFDRFAQGSKDIVRLENGKVRMVGESQLLNEQSIADLRDIRATLLDKRVQVNDLQFLISDRGRMVIADPLAVNVDTMPSKSNLRMIDLLIEAANKNGPF